MDPTISSITSSIRSSLESLHLKSSTAGTERPVPMESTPGTASHAAKSDELKTIVVPYMPAWNQDRAWLTSDLISAAISLRKDAMSTKSPESMPIATLPLAVQEYTVIEDLLYLLMGVEGKYIRFDDAALAIADVQFILDPTMGWQYSLLSCVLKKSAN